MTDQRKAQRYGRCRPSISWWRSATPIALNGVFAEVIGLNSETQVIEYRHSNSPAFSSIKMPGISKMGNVTLKRGIFKSGDSFWTWHSSIQQNPIKRQNIVISLMDEKGAPTMKWNLINA